MSVDVLRQTVLVRLEEAVPEVARRVVELAKAESIFDSGETEESHGWLREGPYAFHVIADTPQAAIQDKGTDPYTIRPKGRAGGGRDALYWDGALYPVAKVNHPGSKKNVGWWSEADWPGRVEQAFREVL